MSVKDWRPRRGLPGKISFRWSDGYENAVEFTANRDTFIDQAVNAAIDLRNKTGQHYHDRKLGKCRYYRHIELHHYISDAWIEVGYILARKEPGRDLASTKLPTRFVCANRHGERDEKSDLEMIMELAADVWAMVEATEEWFGGGIEPRDRRNRA